MIQRIQTVYLLLGAVASLALLLMDPIWQSDVVASEAWFGPVLVVAIGLTALSAVVAIFLYKDLKRQRSVVGYVRVLAVVMVGVLYGGLYLGNDLAVTIEGAAGYGKLVALLLPIVAYVCFFMARRGIQKDLNLIKSMDRLR